MGGREHGGRTWGRRETKREKGKIVKIRGGKGEQKTASSSLEAERAGSAGIALSKSRGKKRLRSREKKRYDLIGKRDPVTLRKEEEEEEILFDDR